MRAFAELNEQGTKIEVHFPYEYATKEAVKKIGGSHFVGPEKGGPYWTVPLDLKSARTLREIFGRRLVLGDALKDWGKAAVARERNLSSLVRADFADLQVLPDLLPALQQRLLGRPFQTADVAFMATTNCINANEPSLGKTVETIAAAFEAGLGDGPHLVSAPVSTLDDAWATELRAWQPHPFLIASGSAAEKRKVIAEAYRMYEAGEPFWLVTNPATVRLEGIYEETIDEWTGKKHREEVGTRQTFPELFQIEWNTVTIDEYRKMGLSNVKTLGARAFHLLKSKRRWCCSGTPMGGKPINLWGALHWLDPVEFSSKWNWAENWLEVTAGYNNSKNIGGIKAGREDEFYAHLAPWMVRRLKKEVMADLPDKQFIDLWCHMSAKQTKQYNDFAADAEVRIEEFNLTATGILAEYTRLKQLANARCEIEIIGQTDDGMDRYRVKPTLDSAKMERLLEKLDEVGIRGGDEDEGDFKVIVGTQSKEFANLIFDYLTKTGVNCAKITGDVTKRADRTEAMRRFEQDDDTRVIVLTTTAGGVGINLERAGAVAVLDETWDPDDQAQLIERGDRGSRTTPLEVWHFRTRGTIDEYIKEVNDDKSFLNRNILDTRRQGFRATGNTNNERIAA